MKIICIGLNYHDHIQEFNNITPENPLFFLKPETAITSRNRPFFLPDFSNNIQYEVELLLKISKLGKYIQKKFAHTYYDEIGLGIDFTARDLQTTAMKFGYPWELSKSFDGSAVIGKFVSKKYFQDINNVTFSLLQNENTVQSGNSKNMIFDFDTIIEYVSQFITLKIGDIIFTGTPAGMGKVSINDYLEGFIGTEKFFHCRIK